MSFSPNPQYTFRSVPHKVIITTQHKSVTQHPLLDDPDFPEATLAKSKILKVVLLYTRLSDYYLNYACAAHYDEPVDFEYTFALDGHDVVYTYSKVAAELKGEIIREQLLIDDKEVLMKDNERLNISEKFGLTEVAIENLKESANNISLVNYLLGAVPLPKGHALLQLRDFAENMLFFRSLDNHEFIGLKEGGSNIDEFDAFYHHELSYQISKCLFDGPNQVFVTTHDTFLLSNDLLRPDCFFILRNNGIKAICDFTDKELRFGHNLEKLYRGGTFGL